MNYLPILIITILLVILFITYTSKDNNDNNDNSEKIEDYAKYNDINGIYRNPPRFVPFLFSPFWNSTRYTNNMIYDLRGDPIYNHY